MATAHSSLNYINITQAETSHSSKTTHLLINNYLKNLENVRIQHI